MLVLFFMKSVLKFLTVIIDLNTQKKLNVADVENVNKIAEVSCKLFNAARIRKN